MKHFENKMLPLPLSSPGLSALLVARAALASAAAAFVIVIVTNSQT